ncbi:hypothetical protein COCMIDRAFT_94888 [Bipolaris oryzae ATCC 44560]|uniref:Uncharacterized protein n=1 Tax=Bipolaris oryzae ATCC 44560 TaxID=930090 RepID=W6ZQ00_COCMI|nr:uncharacterized protein COCMIDRAFT_94888 [Bipolaris oryzae ATCC 44560]EUC45691.1 hypothetical protein COCMIDRAFT_94888 [Bipolaris oryzae ATCC 44560]
MIYNLVRKSGIPVLASLASGGASQWPCCLTIKYLEARMQATISLQYSLPIQGFDDKQTFTLLYNADNLVPGNTSVQPSPISLPQDRLHDIARQGNAHLKTLTLTLKAPCPVWCPQSPGPMLPKEGFGTAFAQFVKLASATQIYILFDWNWLHKDHYARFDHLIQRPGELTGIPVDPSSARHFRLADWSILGPADDVASDAPPPYIESSKKRPRQVTTSPSPEPSIKRALLSPTSCLLSSPTEKASAVSVLTPSPKLRSPSPITSAPDFQDVLKNTLETMLPQMLQAILPDMLPRVLAAPCSSSPSTSFSRSSPKPKPRPKLISSLGNLLNAHATARLEAQLEEIYAQTLEDASQLRSAADDEFHELLEEQKLDVAMIKEDSIMDLNRVFDDKLAEFKESTVDMVDEMEKRVELVYADVCERLDELVSKKVEFASRRGDVEKIKDSPGVTQPRDIQDRGRRAVSLPL